MSTVLRDGEVGRLDGEAVFFPAFPPPQPLCNIIWESSLSEPDYFTCIVEILNFLLILKCQILTQKFQLRKDSDFSASYFHGDHSGKDHCSWQKQSQPLPLVRTKYIIKEYVCIALISRHKKQSKAKHGLTADDFRAMCTVGKHRIILMKYRSRWGLKNYLFHFTRRICCLIL